MSLTFGPGPLAFANRDHFNVDLSNAPKHLLYLHDIEKRIRGVLGGETVVDTRRAKFLHESGMLPQWYLPLDDIRSDFLVESSTSTHCPFKGDASYYSLKTSQRSVEDGIWTYRTPLPAASWLEGLAGFYFDRLDTWYEEDDEVFIAGYGAYEQGNGLIQVPAAWSLLKTNAKTVDITSSVPVDTALEQFLARPGFGVGIHDREGVTIGQPYTRQYTFTRTSGAGGSTTFNLSLVGNDGTFSLGATSISLPKGQARTLTVSINPNAYGAHSAILNFDDPTNPGIEYQTLNTVVVARDFTSPGYAHTITGTVARNQALSYFFEVAPGTPAFKVDFSGPSSSPGTGQARFLRFHPYGVGFDSNSSLSCYSPPVVPGGSCAGGTANSRTVSNPQPGVWEVTVEARRTSDLEFTPFTLTASVLGATVTPNPDVIPTATVGVPVNRSYTITNEFGAFTGRAVGTTLGSALRDRPTIANLEQQSRNVTVTTGTTSLRATIGNPSDAAADLDLFVYNCTTGPCVLAGQSADGDSEESVTIASPAAGLWVVLVDGFAVPSGSTQYDYLDVFANPAFGAVAITDANALRPAGAVWTVPGTVTANTAPAAGRVLLGRVEVRTDANVLIGTGDVIVQSVI